MPRWITILFYCYLTVSVLKNHIHSCFICLPTFDWDLMWLNFYHSTQQCQPECHQGCVHGRCVSPDVCECDFGWVGNNCSVQCLCNQHSNCQSVSQRKVCLECHNNTQVSQHSLTHSELFAFDNNNDLSICSPKECLNCKTPRPVSCTAILITENSKKIFAVISKDCFESC